MPYDADHRRRILEEVRSACQAGKFEHGARLLQQATANLAISKKRIPMRMLRSELGASCADQLVKWCTVQACMYCKGGLEECEECSGKGESNDKRACRDCGGFGFCRCPFCNGTSFAGYDFVPAGLRVVVMSGRVRIALARITSLSSKSPGQAPDVNKLLREVIDLNRCRGVLANACEQARMGDEVSPGQAVFSHTTAKRIESACKKANLVAENTIRRYLKAVANRTMAETRLSSGSRIALWTKIAGSPHLSPSILETPMALRER